MSNPALQSFKNHAKVDPPFHYVLFSVLVLNLVFAGFYLWYYKTLAAGWFLVLSIVAFVALFRMRQYPLKVQDRVIRLEERMRLQALAPEEWHTQIYRLTEEQLIALRFAADGEVVELAKQALEHNLTRKQIKERIRDWRPDNWRI